MRLFHQNKTVCYNKKLKFLFLVTMRITERSCEADNSERSWIPPNPAGYFSNGQWFSRQCKTQTFSYSSAEGNCLRDKVVYLLGDSNIRQWYQMYTPSTTHESIWKTLASAVNRPWNGRSVFAVETSANTQDIWSPRESHDSYYNITFRYSSHGLPLLDGGSPSNMPYITDQLDSIREGEKVYVVISVGSDLLLYHPSVYISRLISIKNAVLRLHKRSPDTMVFFKGLGAYPMDENTDNLFLLSDWLAYRYDTIARNIIKQVPGLIYLDSFDLTTLYHDYEKLGSHLPNDLLHTEIKQFLSFVCPSFN